MRTIVSRYRPVAIISAQLLNSVGIRIKKTMSGIKFVYRQEVVDELKQLGFSIDMLKVKGGEMPLPLLRQHVDEQAAQEAYWSSQAEIARYELSVEEDKYNFWYESKYSKCFGQLQERGVPKPTKQEVDARISLKYGTVMLKNKEHLRKIERRYRLLYNACFAAIVTKGKMLQTLRNIIQGGSIKIPAVENEVIGEVDLSNVKVGG